MKMKIMIMITYEDDPDDHNGHDDHEKFCTQTLGAGSVEEQLAFEARYEFVTITKVNEKSQVCFT